MSGRPRPALRIGIDTGGTFTDVVAWSAGRSVAFKIPSTPDAPERAVLEGLARLGAGAGDRVRHGSTVATNTLLERRGARVTLLTTAGFEDLLEIGRQTRPALYALAPRRDPALVPAPRRLGVVERQDAHGRVWIPLSPGTAARACARARATNPEAVAVMLLHAYASPAHERRLGRALAALGVPVVLSSALCPEYREFERAATTVVNAYLAPRCGRYLAALARGTRARIEVVLSHGGTAPVGEAVREPVRQLLSGPAAGLAAAARVATSCGLRRALTLDVGGTSTDVAFVTGRELPRQRAREIAGHPILLPLLDVHTVGAGGGSIATRDAAGLLRVGPESAGADPGPASYGRGGPATVTDALIVLGRIPGDSLGGGALPLDRRAALRSMTELGRRLGGRTARAAAAGVVRLAEAHIEAALRAVSVERGRDPRTAGLVAFGGGGGLHACVVAEALGIRTVICPADAGTLSAWGALLGGLRRERSRTVLRPLTDASELERIWRRLEAEVRAAFPAGARGRLRLERWAELRYAGQSHEISLTGGAGLAARFHRAHRRRFGFAHPDRVIEAVTLEARGSLAEPPPPPRRAAHRAARPRTRVPVWEGGRRIEAEVIDLESMPSRGTARGPAIGLQSGATLWIPPGWRGAAGRGGAWVLRRERP